MDSPQFGFQKTRFQKEHETGKCLESVHYPNFSAFLENPDDIHASEDYIYGQTSLKASWKDVEKIVRMTNLPVIAKGVLTTEDALRAQEAGCKGVIVSNHGGRQLDCTPSPLEVLPSIVEAVSNDLTVMMDSGVNSGHDAFKALALGAQYVFMGRAVLWGLIVGGEKGAEQVLLTVKEELKRTMCLSGCPNVANITRNCVRWRHTISRL